MPPKGSKARPARSQLDDDYEDDGPEVGNGNSTLGLGPITAAAAAVGDKGQGIKDFELPKSSVTKLAKSALPATAKMQKDVPLALTKGSTIFINYLCSIAAEHAAAKGNKTITVDHVFAALAELEWGEADSEKLRKDLNRQLRAYRYNAEKKKEAKATGKEFIPLGSPKKAKAPKPSTSAAIAGASGTTAAAPAPIIDLDNESDEGEDEDGIPLTFDVSRARSDGFEGAEESEFDDDVGPEIDEEDEEDDEEEEEEEQPPVDPNDFEDEMGKGLDDTPTNGDGMVED